MNIELPYAPFHYQSIIHNSKKRFKLIVAGRRAGKTKLAFYELLAHALGSSNRLGWWVATTYRDAKEIGWQFILDILPIIKPAIKNISYTDLRITFLNNSQIYFKGSDNPDALRGRGLTFLVMDEAAFQQEDVWKKVLRPALSDREGKALLISSPNGRNWFYTQHEYAKRPDIKGWMVDHWPTSINPLISPSDIEDAMNELSEQDFKQEYLAEFVTKAGMVYSDFDEANIIESFEYNFSEHDIYLGADFGYANPTSIIFAAVSRLTDEVVIFDEIYESRKTMSEILEMMERKLVANKIRKSEVKFIATDPAGNAEELTSGLSPVDTLRMEGGYEVINKGSRIAPGLALVRAFICNAKKKRRLYVVREGAPNLIRSIYGYSYKAKSYFSKDISEEPEKDGIHDHAVDALRYFFINAFDTSKYVASNIVQQDYLSEKSPALRQTRFLRCGKCGLKYMSKDPNRKLCSSCEEGTTHAE